MKKIFTAVPANIIFFSFLITTAITCLLAFLPPHAPPVKFLADTLFINIGFAGDGLFAAGVLIYFSAVVKNKRAAISLAGSLVVCALSCLIFKNLQGGDSPKIFFEQTSGGEGPLNNLISSHTAVAFTLAVFFPVRLPNRLVKALLILCACCVALSQLYFHAATPGAVLIALLPGLLSPMLFSRSKLRANNKFLSKKQSSGSRTSANSPNPFWQAV